MIALIAQKKRRRLPVENIEVRVRVVGVSAGSETARRFDAALLKIMSWGAA